MKISKTRLQEIIKEEYEAIAPLFEEDIEEELIYEEDDDDSLEEEFLFEDELDEDFLYEDGQWALGPSDYIYQEADDSHYGAGRDDFLMGEDELYEGDFPERDDINPCDDMLLEIMKMLPDIPQNAELFNYLDELLREDY